MRAAFARWSRRDLAMLALGTGAILGGLGYFGSSARATSPLTDGLERARGTIDAEFARRVATTFPLGSHASGLVTELKRQGFTSTDWLGPGDTERVAQRVDPSRACEPTARIRWRADAEGRLREVKGSYREEGCR